MAVGVEAVLVVPAVEVAPMACPREDCMGWAVTEAAVVATVASAAVRSVGTEDDCTRESRATSQGRSQRSTLAMCYLHSARSQTCRVASLAECPPSPMHRSWSPRSGSRCDKVVQADQMRMRY